MDRTRPRSHSHAPLDADEDLSLASGGDRADDPDRIAEADAQQVWRIAARLQAEAARRLEERSQQLAHESAPAGALTGEARFSRSEVDHIAESAGIDPAFVALAWREVEAARLRPDAVSDERHRRASAFLGTDQERLSVTRTFQGPPEAVLAAMQRVFPADPYRLVLAEIIGDADTLVDAALIFDVPQVMAQMSATGGYTAFSYAMSIADLTRVVVTLHPLGDGRTEATVAVDLRHGKAYNLTVGAWLTGVLALAGGIIGSAVGLAAGDGGALALAAGAALGTSGLGSLSYLGYRAAYASGLRKGERALADMLRAVDVDMRAGGAFARPATSRPHAGAGPDALPSL